MAYRSRLLTILKPKGFDPLSLNPTILARPSNSFSRTGGSFTVASSQYLSVASNASVQVGASVPFWLSFWCSPTAINTGDYQMLVSKNNEYDVRINPSGSTLSFTNTANAGFPTVPVSAGSWQHFLCYSDGAGTWGVIKDGGAATTASYSNTASATGVFQIGARNAFYFYGGLLDNILFGKSPTESFATIATALYNSGNGLAFQDITSAQESDWGIVSGWLDNSLTADAFGSNTLTNVNSVSQGAGKVSAVAVDNDPTYFVNTIGDTDFIQNTLASRPFYRTANKGFWQYDGTNDVLSFVNPIAVTFPVSCYAVVDTTNLGSDDRILLDRSPAAAGSPAFYLGAAGTGSYKPYIYWNGNRVTGSAIQAKQIVRWKLTSTNAYLKQNGNAEIDGGAHGQTLGSVDWTAIGNNGTQQPDMDLYEFLLFNGIDLSSDDDAAIFDYLNTKHSVY